MGFKLRCDMDRTCGDDVTHIDAKGFVYCTKHGAQRKLDTRCRKLSAREIVRLENDLPISYDGTPTYTAEEIFGSRRGG